jgi:hypothetical protein
MFLLYHAYVYLEFLILACTIYILAPPFLIAVNAHCTHFLPGAPLTASSGAFIFVT